MIESGSPILFAVKTISDNLFQGLRYVKLKAESLLAEVRRKLSKLSRETYALV